MTPEGNYYIEGYKFPSITTYLRFLPKSIKSIKTIIGDRMKRLLVVTLVVLGILLSTALLSAQPTLTFQKAKELAMKEKPDSNGDYMVQMEVKTDKGPCVYSIGYMVKDGIIGSGIACGTNTVICVYKTATDKYAGAIYESDNMVHFQMLTPNQADAIMREVLSKFTKGRMDI